MRDLGFPTSTDPKDPRGAYEHFRGQLVISMTTNTSLLFFFGASALLWLTLGIGAWVLSSGLFLAFELLALNHAPVYALFRKMLRSQNPPAEFAQPPSLWRILSYPTLAIPGLFIFVGAKIMVSLPFCEQSLICVLVTVIRRFFA